MLVIGDLSAEVPDTNAFHWNFEEYSQESQTDVLLYGYNASDNASLHECLEKYARKIYFNNWAPCEFAQKREENGHDGFKKEHFFDEIYSICPYSNAWLNSLNLGRVYKDIFYPFHVDLIPDELSKQYDVIYHGGIHGAEHIECLKVMSDYNYRYCSMTHHINALTQQCLRFATNVNLLFQEKINLIAQSKISVCYNLVHVNPDHVPTIQSYEGWKNNDAFSEVGKWNVMPQFKTRMHEAAMSKTLNLVQKDSWNIAEDYYVPDEEFIYFTDAADLSHKIRDISNDWANYHEIVDRAYQKSLSYTCEKFVEKIRGDK